MRKTLSIEEQQQKAQAQKILADSLPLQGNVRAKQFAACLTIGTSTLWAHVASGRIQRPKKLSPRVSVWSVEYVRELMKNGIPDEQQNEGEAA